MFEDSCPEFTNSNDHRGWDSLLAGAGRRPEHFYAQIRSIKDRVARVAMDVTRRDTEQTRTDTNLEIEPMY